MFYTDPFIVDNVDTQASSMLKITNSHLSRVVFDAMSLEPVVLSVPGKVVINPLAHLSPRQRMVQIAQQTKLKSDAPPLELYPMCSRYTRIYTEIKKYYLASGHSLEQWIDVAGNLHSFNQVWRKFLMLPPGVTPPPEHWRFVLPSQSSI